MTRKEMVAWFGIISLAAACSNAPQSDSYTKSGNCSGPSVSTLRFAPEPTAAMFPQTIWFEECPNGKYFMRIGERPWTEITKKQADTGAVTLKQAGRSFVRVVD